MADTVYTVVFTWEARGPCMTVFLGSFSTFAGALDRIAELESDNARFPVERVISDVRPSDGDFHIFEARVDRPAVSIVGERGRDSEGPVESEGRDALMRGVSPV